MFLILKNPLKKYSREYFAFIVNKKNALRKVYKNLLLIKGKIWLRIKY